MDSILLYSGESGEISMNDKVLNKSEKSSDFAGTLEL